MARIGWVGRWSGGVPAWVLCHASCHVRVYMFLFRISIITVFQCCLDHYVFRFSHTTFRWHPQYATVHTSCSFSCMHFPPLHSSCFEKLHFIWKPVPLPGYVSILRPDPQRPKDHQSSGWRHIAWSRRLMARLWRQVFRIRSGRLVLQPCWNPPACSPCWFHFPGPTSRPLPLFPLLVPFYCFPVLVTPRGAPYSALPPPPS